VRLELHGMKMTRGPVVWKRVAAEFKIRGGKQAVYDWLVAKCDELRAVQEHQVEVNGRLVREVGGEEVH
jgi:hypothetical protein